MQNLSCVNFIQFCEASFPNNKLQIISYPIYETGKWQQQCHNHWNPFYPKVILTPKFHLNFKVKITRTAGQKTRINTANIQAIKFAHVQDLKFDIQINEKSSIIHISYLMPVSLRNIGQYRIWWHRTCAFLHVLLKIFANTVHMKKFDAHPASFLNIWRTI